MVVMLKIMEPTTEEAYLMDDGDEDIVLLMLVPFKALLMSIFKWGSTYSKKIQCHSNKNSCKRKLTMSIH